ncbi:unnamed protein product [Prunus armeniaca]
MAEAEAVREALTRCLEFGFVKVAVETDSLSLVKMLKKEGAVDLEIEGILFDIQCLTQQADQVEFLYAPRICKQAAHKVAAHVSRTGGRHSWDVVCPEWLFNCLAHDEGRQRGIGRCLRDHHGVIVFGFAGAGTLGLDVLGTKLVAARVGLLELLRGDWCSNVGNLVEDLIRLLAQLDVLKGIYQPRQGNGVSHALAQFELHHGQYFVREDVVPPWLVPLIDKDIDGET